MYSIDELYNLIFEDKSKNKITVDKSILFKTNSGELSSFPEGTKLLEDIFETRFLKLKFPDDSIFKIFVHPIKCKFICPNSSTYIVDLYSYEHLRLILEKLEFQSPFYYSNFFHKNIYIDKEKIEETKFNYDQIIEILEKTDDKIKIKNIYEELKELYSKEISYTYKFLNPNYNRYSSFPDKDGLNLSESFRYLKSNVRTIILNKIEYFVNNTNSQVNISELINENEFSLNENDPFLLPICGPHGNGKTITALYIHKYLYLNGKKGIYLNLKYFSNSSINLEDKIDALIKECFFIVDSEDELFFLYQSFLELNNFYPSLSQIKDFIQNKKDNKIFMILDQYQEKYHFRNFLNHITNIKIILLSSINEKDVKANIILTYKNKCNVNKRNNIEILNPRGVIKYNYIENLVDKENFSIDSYKNIFRKKIEKYENDETKINNELNFTYEILEAFNFIPKYVFGYINYYDSIFDLMFHEYSNIFKKLDLFVKDTTINIEIIDNLIKDNILTNKNNNATKTIQEEKFVGYLTYIPLKYISYRKTIYGEYSFYYTFPLFEKILKEYIEYINSKSVFFKTNDNGQKGNTFEKIVKIQFKCFKKLNIDGYFKVNKLVNMDFTEKYKLINQNYFQDKHNIFIDQVNNYGEDYDFGIYQPQSKNLLLIQSKYIISHDTVKKNRSMYVNTAKNALNSFKKKTNEMAERVYFMFISSVEFNYKNRKYITEKILTKKMINCLFHSVKLENYTMDFRNDIKNIECKSSFMLIPNMNIYEQQIHLYNIYYENLIPSEGEKRKTNKILLRKKNIKTVNLKDLHREIIAYVKKNGCLKKEIIPTLGSFKTFYNYLKINKILINEKTEYAFIFYIDKFGKFDKDKELGLIYFGDEQNYHFYFSNKKYYNNCVDLINKFEEYFYYAIGIKINKKK